METRSEVDLLTKVYRVKVAFKEAYQRFKDNILPDV